MCMAKPVAILTRFHTKPPPPYGLYPEESERPFTSRCEDDTIFNYAGIPGMVGLEGSPGQIVSTGGVECMGAVANRSVGTLADMGALQGTIGCWQH